MAFREFLFGRPLRSEEQEAQKIGPARGIPILGLDALASAAYGPEAALTILLALGAAATRYIEPISAIIIVLLVIAYFSYRQTIVAYPNGGGAYAVATANLGQLPALLAASALCLDYVLNVAVAISAGVGAIVSAQPVLLPYTLALCLPILAIVTVVNLHGVREAGSPILPVSAHPSSRLSRAASGELRASSGCAVARRPRLIEQQILRRRAPQDDTYGRNFIWIPAPPPGIPHPASHSSPAAPRQRTQNR